MSERLPRHRKQFAITVPDTDPGDLSWGGSDGQLSIPAGASDCTVALSDATLNLDSRDEGIAAANFGRFSSVLDVIAPGTETAAEVRLAVWHTGSGNKAGILTYWIP